MRRVIKSYRSRAHMNFIDVLIREDRSSIEMNAAPPLPLISKFQNHTSKQPVHIAILSMTSRFRYC